VVRYHFDQSLIWHVVFHPGRALWDQNWRHVSLAGYSVDSLTWLHVDVQRAGVNVAMIYRHDEVEDYLTYLLSNFRVVRFGPSQVGSRSFFTPMTCVSFAKHVLGVRSSALRPTPFMRDLLDKYDAKVINGTVKSVNGNGSAETTADKG